MNGTCYSHLNIICIFWNFFKKRFPLQNSAIVGRRGTYTSNWGTWEGTWWSNPLRGDPANPLGFAYRCSSSRNWKWASFTSKRASTRRRRFWSTTSTRPSLTSFSRSRLKTFKLYFWELVDVLNKCTKRYGISKWIRLFIFHNIIYNKINHNHGFSFTFGYANAHRIVIVTQCRH